MRVLTKNGSLALLTAVTFVGCAQDVAPGAKTNDVGGNLKEWSVGLDASVANAGEVTFTVTNNGTIGHEFLVVKTDIALGKIPLDGDHFAEPTDGIEVIDEIGEFAKGTTETLILTLAPGEYQIVCNLPGHYENGMYAAFTVD